MNSGRSSEWGRIVSSAGSRRAAASPALLRATKPAPDIFLAACRALLLAPAECLVVEDAVSGVQAAKAAGARCLGLTTSFDSAALAAADWTARDLAHVPQAALDW